jgi:hypothetical protein
MHDLPCALRHPAGNPGRLTEKPRWTQVFHAKYLARSSARLTYFAAFCGSNFALSCVITKGHAFAKYARASFHS